jgi:radical SAM protein with 4Fe4S-binding SPASM domain
MAPDYTPEERAILINVRDRAQAMGATVNMLPGIPSDLVQVRTSHFKDEGTADGPADLFDASAIAGLSPTRLCSDPWEKAIVTRDGDVYPCEGYHLHHPVASIATRDFADIWVGEEYAGFRRRLLNGESIGCKNCERRGWGHNPLNLFAAEIVSSAIVVGGRSEIRVRNAGAHAWSRSHRILLGTSRPLDRTNSAFAHPSWLSPNRVATHREAVVAPGEIGTFRFRTSAPTDGDVKEYFQFVVECFCWLPNTEIEVCQDAASRNGRGPLRPEGSPMSWLRAMLGVERGPR